MAFNVHESPILTRELFLVLHRNLATEQRWQVQLNWERQRLFILTSIALTVTCGVLFTYRGPIAFLGCIFSLSSIVALAGIQVITIGHRHYQLVRTKLQVIETHLGVHFDVNDDFRAHRFRIRITWMLSFLLLLSAALDAVGAILVFQGRVL
jgi:hypothetical protein